MSHVLSTSSLRAQRSSPESLCGKTLDCFAALAMTEQGAASSSSNADSTCRHTFASSRRVSPELCFVTPPSKPRGRREGRVLTSHPRSAARKWCARKPHSSIQVVPITRPSLRDGWTAYAVLSREPSSCWPPSSQRNSPAPRRLTRMPHSPGLDRSNDGQDHTVLPYARFAISPQFFQPCRQSRKLTDETKPSSAARRNEALGSRRAIRPALGHSHPNAAASTASPARERDDHKIAPQG
ncbi:hypothetical protein ABIB80_001274 [Bradyrhizobium sp. i1.15.2]